ncbi:MAG: 1-phosphofructokinase family hexose kinase [Clostridia bacterium]|nr:1-phosphofructokinase family hexose kinase [Clostridia bacterium]
MKIVTLTLNPAFDVHCYTKHFQPYHENLAHVTANDAGGKGVNISCALTVNGVENTALVVLGSDNGESFRSALEKDGIAYRRITVSGRIRENITLHTDNAPETRISFAGFTASDALIDQVEAELDGLLERESILTFTGRNPEGVTMSRIKQMLINLRNRGVRIVLDSRSFGKQDLIDVQPWLIKPNEEEIGAYTDVNVTDLESAKQAAESLRAQGIENVMISLGAKGAMLSCKDGCYTAQAPKIEALSTIGAGDSSIGGFCAAATSGLEYADMLRYAVAYGSAACMTEGTLPPKAEDVQLLLKKIVVR